MYQQFSSRGLRYLLITVGVLVVLSVPQIAFASTSDLVSPSLFPTNLQWPITAYHLDIVQTAAGTFDWGAKLVNGIYTFVNDILNALWMVYMTLSLGVIAVVTWAYNLQIINLLAGTISQFVSVLQRAIWEPLWGVMAALAFGWMLYYWVKGRLHRTFGTLISTALIVAMSTWVFGNIPTELMKFNNASATLSNQILTTATSTAGLGSQNPDNIIGNTLSTFLIVQPYAEVEFGNQATAQMYENAVMSQPTETARTAYIKNSIGETRMPIAFQGGIATRITNLLLVILPGIAYLLLALVFALMVLWWQFIAIGRASIAATTLILAMWPGYGLRLVAKWAWSVVAAMLYRVFLTIMLTMTLLFSTSISGLADSVGWLPSIVLNIAMFLGVFFSLWDLRKQMLTLPLDGDTLDGNVASTPGSGIARTALRFLRQNQLENTLADKMSSRKSSSDSASDARGTSRNTQRNLNVPTEDMATSPDSMPTSSFEAPNSAPVEDTAASTPRNVDAAMPSGKNGEPVQKSKPQATPTVTRTASATGSEVPLWNEKQSRLGWTRFSNPGTGNQLNIRIPTLDEKGQTLYRTMTGEGMNPLKSKHRQKWAINHPNDVATLESIGKYAGEYNMASEALRNFREKDVKAVDGSEWVSYYDPTDGREMTLRNPVLNTDERTLYRTMNEQGYNPRDPESVSRWISTHPQDEPTLENIEMTFESMEAFSRKASAFKNLQTPDRQPPMPTRHSDPGNAFQQEAAAAGESLLARDSIVPRNRMEDVLGRSDSTPISTSLNSRRFTRTLRLSQEKELVRVSGVQSADGLQNGANTPRAGRRR